MAQIYAFLARNQSGKRLKGKMEASSEMNVIRYLEENGFIPTYIEEKVEERPLFQRKVSLKDLTLLCRQLSTMVKTGIPIIQSLVMIKNQIKDKKLADILDSVTRDLANGDTVAEAFNKHKQFFPTLFNKLLYAAEATGELDYVLNTLAENFQKELKLRSKLKSAFSYPIFILIFAVIMIVSLIIFVLPTFVGMFGETSELPFLTKMLLGMNQLMTHYGLFLLIGLGIAIFLFFQWIKNKAVRRKIDYLFCHLPLVGDMIRKNSTFRFSQTLHDLHSSGVVIEKSLQICSEVVPNSYYREEILKVRDQVIEGSDIATALQKSDVFPSLLVSMVRIGEESGELESLLKDVSEYSQSELEQKINDITALIEPLLMIIIGLIVGVGIIGILLPMYDGMMKIN